MISAAWKLLVDATLSFIEDEALSRGAAIAFYAVTSLAPVLLIVIAIAGLVFGRDAAQDAIRGEFGTLMGQQAADVLQSVIAGASTKSSGIIAAIAGIAMLIVTASGVFVNCGRKSRRALNFVGGIVRLTVSQCQQYAQECIAMADSAGRENVAALQRMAETWLQIAEELLAQMPPIPDDQNAPSTDKVQ